jgi:L-arabinokinase
MYRSHASYRERCGLGTPETDVLVELAQSAGPEQGVYGARMTGGGAGGTVAVLVAGTAGVAAVHDIAAEYTRRTERHSAVLAGSADGALRVAPERLTTGRAAIGTEGCND